MRFTQVKRPIAVTAATAFVALLSAGCGGGGGGSSPSSPSTVTVTGTVDFAGTNSPAANTTVAISGTSLSAISNSTGIFSISGAPSTGTVTFVFTDSIGDAEGRASVNLSSIPVTGSNTKNVGTLSVTQNVPPPPPTL
jgi:hypothetical protein